MKKNTLMIIIIAAIVVIAAGFGLRSRIGSKAPAPEAAQTEQAAEAAEAEQPADAFDANPASKLFSIEIPEEFAGLVEYEIGDTSIHVYDKEQKDGGFGGYAYGIEAYEDPAFYGYTGEKKVGELTAADGKLYDVVISHPSDVQYDFTQGGAVPEAFAKLYDSAEAAAATIKCVDGGTYAPGAGIKGEDLYPEIVKKHALAIAETWDASRLEEEEMSPVYYAMDIMGHDSIADTVGYAYADLDGDGVDELLIGEITDGTAQGLVYDVYTMAGRKPVHIMSGWYRNRFQVLENGDLLNEYSAGAKESGTRVYSVSHNEGAAIPYIAFKTDGYENEEQPWFVAYGSGEEDDEWENITEEEYNEICSRYESLKEITYTPLSSVELPEAEPEEAAEAAAEETAEPAEEAAEGPAEEAAEETEAAEEAGSESAGASALGAIIDMINPWTDITAEEAASACSQLFSIPEGAENVVYSRLEDADAEGPVIQANFDLDGQSYTARAQNAPEEHFLENLGLYYDWTATEDDEIKDWGSGDLKARLSAFVGSDETAELYTWYDEAAACGYSLFTSAEDLDGFDLKAIVEAMKP